MWPNPRETADLVTFTEDIFNNKLLIENLFLCSVGYDQPFTVKTFFCGNYVEFKYALPFSGHQALRG